MSDRIYSKKEIEQLIKKAVELESERSVTERRNWDEGLTIDELKNVAAETGIDPELIERAASDMDALPADFEGNVQVNGDEIASEAWLDRTLDKETVDMLISELNHMYGTTDDVSWWDNLWQDHNGKAKVDRKPNITEWIYTSPMGAFFTRVLLQQRGDRLRIRVSKRQVYNLAWDSPANTLLMVLLPIAFFLGIMGGVTSEAILDTFWPGVGGGVLLSLLSYPLLRYIDKRHIQKYQNEVQSTVRQLSRLVLESSTASESKTTRANKKSSTAEIEIQEERETVEDQPGRLRNNLRE